jgi:hypothetical protein
MNDDKEALPALGLEQFDGPTELPPTDPPVLEDPPEATGDAPKKRRRRRKAAPEPTPTVDPEAERQRQARELEDLRNALDLTFRVGFEMVADWRGDGRWVLTAPECGSMSEAWAMALQPYMGGVAKHMPMLSAVIVTAGVLIPRLRSDAATSKLTGAASGEVATTGALPENPPGVVPVAARRGRSTRDA